MRFSDKNVWQRIKLNEYADFLQGLTYTPNNVSTTGRLVLRSSNIQNSKLVFDDNVYVNMNIPAKISTKENDVLMCVRNGSKNLVGKTALITKEFENLAWGAFMNIIRPKDGKTLLFHFLNSQYFKNQIKADLNTATVNQITIGTLNQCKISIPLSEIEKDKLCIFFNLLDQRIDAQSKIIEDLDTLKNSIMDQLLMRDIFDEISIKDFINQGYARIIKASEMKKFSGEKLYLSTSSIDKNGILKIECKITYNDRPSRASMIPIKHSVWFAKMKDSIKVYKSENDDESKYILSTGFYGILCNEDVVNPDWMVEIFKSNYFNNQKDRFSEGSSMSGIKENQLEDIKVKIFKNKNLEKEYCQLFYILNKKLNVETDYLEKLKEQKKYLLSNMFI